MTFDDIMEIYTRWLHDQIEYFPTDSDALTKIGVSIEKLDVPYNRFYSEKYRIAAEVPCFNSVNKYHEDEDGQKYCILEPVDAEYYEEQYDEIVKKYNIDDYFTADTYKNKNIQSI